MMNMHDRYYEPEDDNSDEIEAEVDRLLKEENNPYTPDNILSAIHNDALEPSLETLSTLLQAGDTKAAGVVFSSLIYTYWENQSRNEANDY